MRGREPSASSVRPPLFLPTDKDPNDRFVHELPGAEQPCARKRSAVNFLAASEVPNDLWRALDLRIFPLRRALVSAMVEHINARRTTAPIPSQPSESKDLSRTIPACKNYSCANAPLHGPAYRARRVPPDHDGEIQAIALASRTHIKVYSSKFGGSTLLRVRPATLGLRPKIGNSMEKGIQSSPAPRRMIVHLVSTIDEGGVGRLLLSMAPHWDSEKYKIEVWCMYSGNSRRYASEMASRGVAVRVLGRVSRTNIEVAAIWRLARALSLEGVSVVHTHTPYSMATAMVAKLFVGQRISHIHHQHSQVMYYQDAALRIMSRVMPLDRLIAVSEASAQELANRFAGINIPITVVLNGIALPDWAGETRELPTYQVFTAARLTEGKNIESLLRAVKMLVEAHPEIRLTVLGDGELRNPLEQSAVTLGIRDRVSFVGHVMDPAPHFASLGIFVLPSLWESFGLALVEAMAHGRPCIASRVGGMKEIIQNEVSGLLVPPNDDAALAGAIARLLSDFELACRIGRNARRRAQEFDIRRTVEQIQSIYSSLS